MAKHAPSEDALWSLLRTLLILALVVLAAAAAAYGVMRYDIFSRAEAALTARIPALAPVASVSADPAEGVAFLQQQETLDPEEIDRVLQERRRAELEAIRAAREAELAALRQQAAEDLEAMRAQRLADLMDGTEDVWAYFSDAVLIGDSRVVGFSYYGFLPEAQVLAELGATILGVEGKLSAIRARDPAYIFLSFGANDLVSYLWPTGPEYAARYSQLVELLEAEFPEAVIVVNSIPAIRESSLHTQSIYYQVPEFNESLRQMCAETGAVFVDNDAVAEAHTDLYAGDGIHFAPGFYPYWAATMIEAVLEAEENALPQPDETDLPALDDETLAEMAEFGLLDGE